MITCRRFVYRQRRERSEDGVHRRGEKGRRKEKRGRAGVMPDSHRKKRGRPRQEEGRRKKEGGKYYQVKGGGRRCLTTAEEKKEGVAQYGDSAHGRRREQGRGSSPATRSRDINLTRKGDLTPTKGGERGRDMYYHRFDGV